MLNENDILIDGDTGHMSFVTVDDSSYCNWSTCKTGDVPEDYFIRRALEIGRAALDILPAGSKLTNIISRTRDENGIVDGITIGVTPLPLTGLAYLKSLPDGSRVLLSKTKYKAVIGKHGLYYVDSGDSYTWNALDSNKWIAKCSAETCPEWSSENG